MDFVTSKIVKKLKEKGYPMTEIPIGGRNNRNASVLYDLPKDHPNWQDCKAWWIPTISQVLKWLREEKKIHITILIITDFSTDADNNICEEWSFWSFYVTNLNDGSAIYDDCQRIDSIEHQSYEASAIAGIEYVLDNLI